MWVSGVPTFSLFFNFALQSLLSCASLDMPPDQWYSCPLRLPYLHCSLKTFSSQKKGRLCGLPHWFLAPQRSRCSVFISYLLRDIFSCILLVIFRWKVKSGSCYSILAGSRILILDFDESRLHIIISVIRTNKTLRKHLISNPPKKKWKKNK